MTTSDLTPTQMRILEKVKKSGVATHEDFPSGRALWSVRKLVELGLVEADISEPIVFRDKVRYEWELRIKH